MEGINHDDYYSDTTDAGNRFFDKYGKNIITYSNFYTLNLDSYTSLIAMLNSIFVPYQAYMDESKYDFVNNLNNLVRIFNKNGFSTHFLTSYGEQQKRFIPNISEWSEVACLKNIDSIEKYAKVTSSKIEMAAEDLAVFDDLIRILVKNPNPFIFQEMVYGHTSAWKEQTGIETIDYYNRYFEKTITALVNNNMADSTLVVMVSDHGPRDDAYDTGNYHIPMFAWARDLSKETKEGMLSHLDFKDILLNFGFK